MTGFGRSPDFAAAVASTIIVGLVSLNIVSFVSSLVYGDSPSSEGVDPAIFSQTAQPVVENIGEIVLMVFGATVVITLLPSVVKAGRVGIRRVLNAREFSPWTFGRVRTLERGPAKFPVTTPCVNCGQTHYSGQHTVYGTELVAFGIPLTTIDSGEVIECETCAEADVVDYGLRADAHDDRVPQREVAR